MDIEDCEVGGIYRVMSRNLKVGVLIGFNNHPNFPGLFVGIREKFDNEYLTTEPGRPLEYLDMLREDLVPSWEGRYLDMSKHKELFDILKRREVKQPDTDIPTGSDSQGG